MILYHGSYMQIKYPDVIHSRKNVDFGPGFYTTPLFEQARKWSMKFKNKGKRAIVSVYELDESVFKTCSVKRFDSYSKEWLEFVLTCRQGEAAADYDIVMGGVADDRVFNTIELFLEGLIDKTEAIHRLRFQQPNYQTVFRSQKVIDQYLHFERSEEI